MSCHTVKMVAGGAAASSSCGSSGSREGRRGQEGRGQDEVSLYRRSCSWRAGCAAPVPVTEASYAPV